MFGWIRTSAPYGWFGSSAEPLSWMVSGNSRPLIAKYRLSQRVDVVRAAGLDRVVQVGVDLAEQQQVLAAGSNWVPASYAKSAPAAGRTISAPYRPISTCLARSEPLSYR